MFSLRFPFAAALAALLMAPVASFAQSSEVPSHCAPNETVFLSAKMKRVISNPKGITYKDTGKILSLCADKSKDPVSKLSYRFGPVGTVELEQVATAASKFGTTSRNTGPRMSEDLYFFHVGEYSYYIVVAGGMATGISLNVYQGKKKIVDLFSGNDTDVDYVFPSSVTAAAVLAERKPKHNLD